jgi:hypothetical protein
MSNNNLSVEAEVRFPIKKKGLNVNQFYYHATHMPDMHFDYILNVLKSGGFNVSVDFDPTTSLNWKYLTMPPLSKPMAKTKFEVRIDEKSVLFDITDVYECTTTPALAANFDAVFLTHYHEDYHGNCSNIYPFSVVNFTDWDLYDRLRGEVTFLPEPNKLVLNNQRPVGQAKIRRTKVSNMLKTSRFKSDTSFYINNQSRFFLNANQALVSVHVPGCREDVLDRAQVQMMGLGVCTISPLLDETFANYNKLEAWVHYIPCENLFDDLLNKIEWCESNPNKTAAIGRNAQRFFDDNIHPTQLVKWVKECLND